MSGIMIPEHMFHRILALGEGWRVRAVDYVENASQVLIRVKESLGLWKTERCPHCKAQAAGGYDHAPERCWRPLNVCQLQSEIVCALPRGQCKACKKGYTVRSVSGEMKVEEDKRCEIPFSSGAFSSTTSR